jgi:tetratricopeptide (TPR) repeat protein
MLIVQVCDFGNDGDAEYRMHAPLRQLGKIPGLTAIDCHFSHRCLPALASLADVLVVQFINDWELLSLCQRRREAGLITVFEANDYFFDLQPWSPIGEAWLDRTVQELYLKWLVTADGVQTSTGFLAQKWRERGANTVAVFPNQLVAVDPLPQVPDRPLTIGWGGSPGHFADWYQLAPLLTQWLAAHPEVHLSVMTHELAHSFVPLEPHRYHFTRFGSLGDYVRFLKSLDIGLAPLIPTDYNRGRSDVKFLEYASQGVAGIYADLEPYQSSVVHGMTGLLSQSPEQTIEHLESLRTDPAFRARLRHQAHEYVLHHRRLCDNVVQRVDWYQSLLKRQVDSSSSLPKFVEEAAAAREENYWQLRPGEPERSFLASNQLADKQIAITRLTQQLQTAPDYLAVLTRQGQLLNDVREYQQAFAVLEKARALSPKSPRVLSEIGRTWFCSNNVTKGRQALIQAIEADPNYLPAWQYLLRLLAFSKATDGPDWGRRAEERFPTCYPLTLLAAQLYPSGESLMAMKRVVDRFDSTLVPRERDTALRAIRQTLATVIQSIPNQPELIPLLRRACEIFPESAWLANELGTALFRSGRFSDACHFQAKGLRLRQQATTFREEFPTQESSPWSWQFADHILRHVPETSVSKESGRYH